MSKRNVDIRNIPLNSRKITGTYNSQISRNFCALIWKPKLYVLHVMFTSAVTSYTHEYNWRITYNWACRWEFVCSRTMQETTKFFMFLLQVKNKNVETKGCSEEKNKTHSLKLIMSKYRFFIGLIL
jgi:hypothetical protein